MNKAYFYTETAWHHHGEMDYMKSLIDASKNAGADGIKFQVMTRANDFISTNHTVYEKLGAASFDLEQWAEIFTYTKAQGLGIVMMPLNQEAFKLLDRFDVSYLDIHSVSFYDQDLLDSVKASGKEIILGVGGRTLDEITEKMNFFGDKLKVLMVGFQAFPSELGDVKIGKISFLKNMFPECYIGYADHSGYDHVHAVLANDYARLLGAEFFEKHISVTEGVERFDFSAAVSPEKIKESIDRIRFIEQNVMTDFCTSFEMNEKEITYRNRQLRCIANRNLSKDTVLQKADIVLKLIDNPEPSYNRIEDLIGKTLQNDLAEDAVIKQSDILG